LAGAWHAPAQLARHLVDEFLLFRVQPGLIALTELRDLDPARLAVVIEKVDRERASA
jgi:hypothetical protein